MWVEDVLPYVADIFTFVGNQKPLSAPKRRAPVEEAKG